MLGHAYMLAFATPAYFVQKTSCEPYREYTAVLAHANAQYFSVAVGNDAEGQLEVFLHSHARTLVLELQWAMTRRGNLGV